jgi:hypothetical protein
MRKASKKSLDPRELSIRKDHSQKKSLELIQNLFKFEVIHSGKTEFTPEDIFCEWTPRLMWWFQQVLRHKTKIKVLICEIDVAKARNKSNQTREQKHTVPLNRNETETNLIILM